MNKIIKNRPASVKAKLMNLAKFRNIDFDFLLLRYMQERLLYRLSASKYIDYFVLKGGLLLICFEITYTRPTLDIDFLAQKVKNTQEELKRIFRDIVNIDYDDGIKFFSESIYSEEIKKGEDYHGVRIKINATLGKAKKILQIDIGFGDEVIPEPMQMDFPTILEGEYPKIKAYSIESVISEKFEVMVKLNILNSRMKDFYDIYSFSMDNCFSSGILIRAIKVTFSRRETPLAKNLIIFDKEFYFNDNRQRQWQAYLRKIKEENVSKDFSVIMLRIIAFLKPVVLSIKDNKIIGRKWSSEQGLWV